MEEDASLEAELLEQIESHTAALADIDEALSAAESEELQALRDELQGAVQAAQQSLLQIKQARLLGMVGKLQEHREAEEAPISSIPDHLGDEERRLPEWCKLDAACRFRYTDGRWYPGMIVHTNPAQAEPSAGMVLVAFAQPTMRDRVLCRFFKQGDCRYKDSCRSSHGLCVPVDALRLPKEEEDVPQPGSRVIALRQSRGGLWCTAEVQSIDELTATVAFQDDGERAKVGRSQLATVRSAESDDDSGSDKDADSDSDSDSDYGLSEGEDSMAVAMLQEQSSSDTATFAGWEAHTKGIASRLLARMGFVAGKGLGKDGQGLAAPLLVNLRPQGRGLGGAKSDEGGGIRAKKVGKKKRGGERSRRKKFAAAARKRKQDQRDADSRAEHPGLFGIINKGLHADSRAPDSGSPGGYFDSPQTDNDAPMNLRKPKDQTKAGKKPAANARSLMSQAEETAKLQVQLERVSQMMHRNKGDKATLAGLQQKEAEIRRKMGEVASQHSQISQALKEKKALSKMMKF